LNKFKSVLLKSVNLDYEKSWLYVKEALDVLIDQINAILQNQNLELLSHRTITPSLENVFIHLVKKAS